MIKNTQKNTQGDLIWRPKRQEKNTPRWSYLATENTRKKNTVSSLLPGEKKYKRRRKKKAVELYHSDQKDKKINTKGEFTKTLSIGKNANLFKNGHAGHATRVSHSSFKCSN